MIAALPMYDRPETAAANDRLWAGIRDRLRAAGIDAPDRLARDRPAAEVWDDPGLVLAQTCGLPYRARLHGRVALVGTPDYGVEGCAPGYYRSALVVRADDPRGAILAWRGARLAYNDALSQSGWAAPQGFAALHGFRFADTLATGSHRESARAVAEGRAGIAAIDAVTWRLIRRWDGFADTLRVLAHTLPTPGLPLVTALAAEADAIRAAAAAAIDALAPDDRETLSLRGLARIPAAAYLAVPTPPAPGEGRQRSG
jgi:ABC-type phosphate/phosphonate transport system substrate-binding protein